MNLRPLGHPQHGDERLLDGVAVFRAEFIAALALQDAALLHRVNRVFCINRYESSICTEF